MKTQDYESERTLIHYETDKRVYKIIDGETHWYVATSVEEALRLHAESLGYAYVDLYLDDMGPIDLSIVDPKKDITITNDSNVSISLPAHQWASNEKQGIGGLCSTAH